MHQAKEDMAKAKEGTWEEKEAANQKKAEEHYVVEVAEMQARRATQ